MSVISPSTIIFDFQDSLRRRWYFVHIVARSSPGKSTLRDTYLAVSFSEPEYISD